MPRLRVSKKAMKGAYSLVRYVDDNVYYVCPSRSLKKIGNKTFTKWLDGVSYMATVITSFNSKSILENLVCNIQSGYPKVLLHRTKNSKINTETKNAVEFECAYEIVGENILREALNHSIIILDDSLVVPPVASPLLHKPTCIQRDDSSIMPPVAPPLFQEIIEVQTGSERKRKLPQRKHCCFYCYKKLFKIYRHYTEVHKQESEIKQILLLPKKSSLRRNLLDKIRKKGDYIFNTQLKNENEEVVVCRQTLQKHKTMREKDVPCPHCMGYYSKLSIRHHIEKCLPKPQKSQTRVNIQAECRRLENNIHHIASEDLKTKIFPVLNDDNVTNAIRYDEAVINYGNYLCRKYTSVHHGSQIRSNLRALGRLVLALKELNPSINNMYEVLQASKVDLIISGIDKVAGLDKTNNLYRSPATAMLLATELKKLCKLLLMEFIKKGDTHSQKRMEDLHTVFNLEFHVTVNKKGNETQKINNRRKKTLLPKTDQIAQFRDYLENNMKYHINKLNEEYSEKDWLHLAEFTLVHLTVFNRKRPGETQRILIDDYKNYEVINTDEVIDKDFDSISKEQVKKWARIKFTGKLGRNTALLVHRDLGFEALDLILKYRELAGVPKENKYVFGVPSQYRQQQTLQACQLIRKLACQSGIEKPELLRTRLLRQHLATETATSQVDDRLEGRVSDFMSHKRQIHKDYYVMTQTKDDITKVSKLLENFSSSNYNCSNQNTEMSSEDDEYFPHDDELLSDDEVANIMGKKHHRNPWTSEEKNTAREYFYEEISTGVTVSKFKVQQFFKANKSLYKLRTPHLITQWIKGEQKKFVHSEKGLTGKRVRWSTPEKQILSPVVKRHSDEGTYPSLSDCEILVQENNIPLKSRNAKCVKSYIYNEVKRLNRSF